MQLARPLFQPLVPSKARVADSFLGSNNNNERGSYQLKSRSSSSRLRADRLTPLHALNQASVLNCHVAPRVQRPSHSKHIARSLGLWRSVPSPHSMRH
ncbi:hypothetical protein PsorP6_011554 [Peronosclerospora sorghi]|uniref:Uncharacterized protein n=1 Tax=Peronosclerospora sorghi TaxID=230839 RepID=A0ACC0WMV2_9STRA|nr:hypothetical protein PsorP6_011554 [Peronosclerospora sorghi]